MLKIAGSKTGQAGGEGTSDESAVEGERLASTRGAPLSEMHLARPNKGSVWFGSRSEAACVSAGGWGTKSA